MNRIENDLYTTNDVSTEKFSDTLRTLGGKCLKSILTYIDCTKYNENDIGCSHVQKQVCYKK